MNCSLLTQWTPTRQGKRTASPCNDVNESHTHRWSKLDPEERAPNNSVRIEFTYEVFLYQGKVNLRRQPGTFAFGKETQDENWKAQGSYWDSAVLLHLIYVFITRTLAN